MDKFEVLRRPIITEKSTMQQELSKYASEVARDANKNQVKEAVEAAFDVHVLAVHVMMVRGKMRRIGKNFGHTPNWKKAIVTLRPGEHIAVFEGV